MSIALLLLAGQAAGPPPPPLATAESSPTVVVTGRRHSREQAVRHMTRTITPITDAGDPLPRFASPLCPEAAGLPAAAATRFADRMRESARRAGLATGKVGCSPNVTVMFVPSGQAVVRALKEKAPTLFGSLEPHQIRRLAADTGPVHVWSFTETMSRDDDRLRVGTTAGRDAPELQVRSASILQAPIRIVVDGAVMLIDQQPSIGKTLTQLADYATMRVLAQARPVGNAATEPTILSLFDGRAETPVALSEFDLAYLKALYRGEATALPNGKVLSMARQINRALSTTTTEAVVP